MATAMAKRISTSVEDDVHERIGDAIRDLGITRSDLLLALVNLWDEDDTIKQRVRDPARRNREEALRRQYVDRKPRQR